MAIDAQRFDRARQTLPQPGSAGIGTLGERTLHAVLKEYYRIGGAQTEVKLGAHVADLWDGHAVTEIQTRSFDRLRGKLEALLPLYPVRVVYPMARVKWLLWLDEETGAVSDRRRSPKTGSPFMAFAELYKIKGYLTHSNFSLTIALVDLEEYRSLNGWSTDRKRGSSRFDRIPIALAEEVTVSEPGHWGSLIPPGLPNRFTSRDFKAAAKIPLAHAQTALNVLTHVAAVGRVGKSGNAIVYQRAHEETGL